MTKLAQKQELMRMHEAANAPVKAEASPPALLEMAISNGASVEVLERLMGLQERWEANQAKRAFDLALSEARGELPTILKSNQGHNYQYEDLATIARAVDPVLAKHGLSYRWNTNSNGMVTVTCIVSHRDGHAESNSLTANPDTSGSKNPIQALGSAVTYLQRYTLKAALGLSASKDTDAGEVSEGTETVADVIADLKKVKTVEALAKWGEANAERIGRARGVKARVREAYISHMSKLKSENGGVKQQLKASIAKEDAETVDPETGEVFDPDDWLDGLESMLAGCADRETINEVWDAYAQPVIERGAVLEPDQDKAQAMVEKHIERVEKAGGED